MFSSETSLNAYGYLYEQEFNPYDSIDASLVRSDDSCDSGQLKLIAYLKLNIAYTLVITTSHADTHEQGPFTVFVKGSDKIKIKQMSM